MAAAIGKAKASGALMNSPEIEATALARATAELTEIARVETLLALVASAVEAK